MLEGTQLDIEKEKLTVLSAKSTDSPSIPYQSLTTETLKEWGYEVSFHSLTNLDQKEIERNFAIYNPDLFIIDKGTGHLNFKELGPYIRSNYPYTQIILIVGDENIREILRWLDYGVDLMVYRGKFFIKDFTTVLGRAILGVKASRKKLNKLAKVFYPGKYPSAVFQLSTNGPTALIWDFENLEDDTLDIPVDHLLSKLAIEYLILTGQGHIYHESCFILPAGPSKRYNVIVFSFKLDDPDAVDERLKEGYFQLCIFVSNDDFIMFPPVSKLTSITPLIKEVIPDAQSINLETLEGVKFAVLNQIKNIASEDQKVDRN